MAGNAHSHGRRGAEFPCPHLERRVKLARMLLRDPMLLAAYVEAAEIIDGTMDHHGERGVYSHGRIPASDLEGVRALENALNPHLPEKLQFKYVALEEILAHA